MKNSSSSASIVAAPTAFLRTLALRVAAVLCILCFAQATGDDSLAAELTRVVGDRTMNGRTVAVRPIRSSEYPADLHVLFVGRSQLARLGELSAHPRPVLTVTDVAMRVQG